MSEQYASPCFVCCDRCRGHGHFAIPLYGEMFEVFSKSEAREQLQDLRRERRISKDHFPVLARQVEESNLPERRPSDVAERIRLFSEAESWATYYAVSDEENRSKYYRIDSGELAGVVCDFYIASPGRNLRLQ